MARTETWDCRFCGHVQMTDPYDHPAEKSVHYPECAERTVILLHREGWVMGIDGDYHLRSN